MDMENSVVLLGWREMGGGDRRDRKKLFNFKKEML